MALASQPGPTVTSAFVTCAAVVVVSSPFNIFMMLNGWSLLASLFGSYFADNSSLVYVAGPLLNLGSFVGPAMLTLLLLRRRIVKSQRLALFALAGLNLGVCIAAGMLYSMGPPL